MPFVTEVPTLLAPKMQKDLESQGFALSRPAYTLFAARKKGVSCTLYESGKLVVQGKEMAEFIEFYLEPEILKEFPFSNPEKPDMTARIGCDEAGKGDFFGPLTVAGVYADPAHIDKLVDWGVRDSKSMTDAHILKLATKIRSECTYHVIRLDPAKYNELYAKIGNLNKLLAWAHATVIETIHLKTGCRDVIVDQFASNGVLDQAVEKKDVTVNLVQRTKGESDVVVAAASIIARAAFVMGIEELGKAHHIHLPKGASQKVIQAGRKFVSHHGANALGQVAKLHFKTTSEVLT